MLMNTFLPRLFSLITFYFFMVQVHAQKSALFLGNSYTNYNNFPKLVSDIASSLGDSLIYDSNTPGGYTLQGHSTNATSLKKITERDWDYVVLQEQSQRPSFPPSQVQSDVYPYAEILDSLIHENDSCSQTLFYMTWGRKYGDQNNCQFYQPLCTYEGMQKRLRDSYLQMAIDNNASVAPVGMAFKASIQNDSNLNLYTTDNSHPSPAGSYLAACVFYSSMFHKSSLGAYHPTSVTALSAFVLQNIADQTVFDSLSTWRIDTTSAFDAKFGYMQDGTEVTFADSTNLNTADYFWDFGDGNTSNDPNPIHTYTQPGTYIVSLTVQLNCLKSTYLDTVIVALIVPSVNEINNEKSISIFPNPSDGKVTVEIPSSFRNGQLKVSDLQGKIVWSKNLSGNQLESIFIERSGHYVLWLQNETERRNTPLIIH